MPPPEPENPEKIKKITKATENIDDVAKKFEKDISPNKPTDEINDSVADMADNLTGILNDVSKIDNNTKKDLSDVIKVCEKCKKEFENSKDVSDGQLETLQELDSKISKLDVDLGDSKNLEKLEDEFEENMEKLSKAFKKTQKLLKSKLKAKKKQEGIVKDLSEDVTETTNSTKEMILKDGSTSEINNCLSDLLADLENDLNDASKSNTDINSELDDLVDLCKEAPKKFKDSCEVSEEQLEILDKIGTECNKIDIDTNIDGSIEDNCERAFNELAKVMNKTGKILKKRYNSYKPTLANLGVAEKCLKSAASENIEYLEKNYSVVFDNVKNACSSLTKVGEGNDVNVSLDNCIKKCEKALSSWENSDPKSKSSLLTDVSGSVQLLYHYISHPKFKSCFGKIRNHFKALIEFF